MLWIPGYRCFFDVFFCGGRGGVVEMCGQFSGSGDDTMLGDSRRRFPFCGILLGILGAVKLAASGLVAVLRDPPL